MEWKNITNLSIKEIESLSKYQVPELEVKLSLLSSIQKFGRNLKCGALLDCFVNVFVFCKESSFSIDHLTWMIKLQGMLLENCESGMDLNENMKHLLTEINHSALPSSSPSNEGLETKNILNFLMKSFFQHYYLYRFLFTNEQEHLSLHKTVEIERIPSNEPFPPPLEEGILESLYEEYLNPKKTEEDVTSRESRFEESIDKSLENNQKLSPEDDIKVLLSTMDPNDLKNLIKEIADTKFNTVKAELEGKINERETALTKTFNKLQPR